MNNTTLTDIIVMLTIYVVGLILGILVYQLGKKIRNKRKWARAKKRGLERFPIGSTVVRSTADGPVKFKVLDVWASRYPYEDAFCVRFEDEQGTKFRMVEGEPGLGGFELLKYPEPTKLD